MELYCLCSSYYDQLTIFIYNFPKFMYVTLQSLDKSLYNWILFSQKYLRSGNASPAYFANLANILMKHFLSILLRPVLPHLHHVVCNHYFHISFCYWIKHIGCKITKTNLSYMLLYRSCWPAHYLLLRLLYFSACFFPNRQIKSKADFATGQTSGVPYVWCKVVLA